MLKSFTVVLLAAISALAAPFAAYAQSNSSSEKPLQLIVPYGPGNGLDQLAREFAEVLRTQTANTVVIENREGAGGVVGTAYAARSPADGRSILMTAHPPFATAPLLQKTASYDPITSFQPIARVGSVPLVLVTAANSPFKTFERMRAYVTANPDKSNYASSGIGSPGQVFTELLKQATGLPIQEVPYKSTSQALVDVIGGNVLLSMVSVPAAAAHVQAGQLRILAIGSPERLADFPDVPTLAEAMNRPGFEAGVWYGFFAPAGASPEVMRKLSADIAKAAASPSVMALMKRAQVVPQFQNQEQFAASLRANVDAAKKLIANANLSAGGNPR